MESVSHSQSQQGWSYPAYYYRYCFMIICIILGFENTRINQRILERMTYSKSEWSGPTVVNINIDGARVYTGLRGDAHPDRSLHNIINPIDPPKNTNDPTNDDSIVLVTFLFGDSAASRAYLPFFVQSAGNCGVDVVIVGEYPRTPAGVPPLQLPPNVKYVPISWEALIGKAEQLLGTPLTGLRDQPNSYYKVNDFKPLIPALFPELVAPYRFWGHVDSDMVLGDLKSFFTSDLLSSADIFNREVAARKTHGPLTLYRNTHQVNTLYTQSPDLMYIFNTSVPMFFDEWGTLNNKYGKNNTMTGLVHQHAPHLRFASTPLDAMRDGVCLPRAVPEWQGAELQKHKVNCGQCVYQEGKLMAGTDWNNLKRVHYCHYQYFKQKLQQSLLEDTSLMKEILASGAYRVSAKEGFRRL